MSKGPDSRQFRRAQVAVEVHYRTKGSFLVSYSLNISQGGLFLETPNLLPLGTKLRVRFDVPGAASPIETDATVMWVRNPSDDPELPPGMGLQFLDLDVSLGAGIDRLVQDFTGVRLMVVASDTTSSDRLARLMGSILACDVTQDTVSHTLVAGFSSRIDLVLVDLDSTGKDGLKVVQKAHEAQGSPIPVIALTRAADLELMARQAGSSAVMGNPPPYDDLRQKVLEVLGRPCRTTDG